MYSWRKRVIPVLLLRGEGLVKTKRFKNPAYIGDAINAVRIFNEKEVDELALIDITPLRERPEPNYDFLKDITSECFSPLSYGGKVTNIQQIRKILSIGVEKVIINSAAIENPTFLREACNIFGSSTIVGSIDVKKDFWGKQRVYTSYGSKNTGKSPLEIISLFEQCGVGEILLNSIDRDGMQNGYDLDLIKSLSSSVNIPLISCGGAMDTDDFVKAFQHGASAVAAGSKFVFNGKHNAVLITYISPEENEKLLKL
ncbi:AglZ/HisF2 family acetamidino modification protein [Daejeonella lutea]|uniref:imidazole glycerol-phosphate synthase n=1 Tax=Daejeonella lutea TaxID=572036 RepID=A0A1T5FB13_9SPHI|nr:AglZ/HisF2 family acetamidino modification protein [Daejeonella lutea]SKB93363.1 cyclase [Daejeonella lutea]